jgi:hypothetical protein
MKRSRSVSAKHASLLKVTTWALSQALTIADELIKRNAFARRIDVPVEMITLTSLTAVH